MSVTITKEVDCCLSCPEISRCKEWKDLTAEQKFFMKTSPNAVKILPNCKYGD